MNGLSVEVAVLLGVADELLIQRVVSHVLAASVAGRLPALAWHEGLAPAQRQAVHTRWPLACAVWEDIGAPVPPSAADPAELLLPLRHLLLAHRARTGEPAFVVLANVLACACFGSHHLWQDLGAAGRADVSRLMQVAFPGLHDSNIHNLRWKRHLFMQLGDLLGRDGLRPPKCGDCGDYAVCFGVVEPAATPAARTWPLTPSR